MPKYYSGVSKILVAVDCIVFGYEVEEEELKLLLFKRKVRPYVNKWSLIGSFVGEQEDLNVAANRVLEDFTGLDHVFLKELKPYGEVGRDIGGRVISIAYWGLIKLEQQKQHVVNSHGAKWFKISDLPELVLDHSLMVSDALKRLRNVAQNFPIGKELLPEFFTLPQMLQLYRSIYQKDIDDRNFRKKILATSILIKLDHKDKNSSKKGAYYFKFDEKKYAELLEKGYHIDW